MVVGPRENRRGCPGHAGVVPQKHGKIMGKPIKTSGKSMNAGLKTEENSISMAICMEKMMASHGKPRDCDGKYPFETPFFMIISHQ